ncbi:MAG TPA: aminotransferase class I/II-fold pyridoxal phosphate-dependent enzyme [Thermomicrobiaceae bacterium]|nr:aminotransferase class I/II-fold pyridoxal phosphate-dependent enzyme [Thermomicrobiaceae bacterium]
MTRGDLDQRAAPFLDAWLAYRAAGVVPYSTPGHKGGRGASPELVEGFGVAALGLDIPHGGGVDDTHLSHGYLRAAEGLAAAAWGADEARFLVNGSTTGNHAFLLATCRDGDEVIVARNLHKSLLAGLVLSGARPVWVRPAVDPETNLSLDVAVADVRAALDAHPAARAVILVSPAYTGVSSDLPAIAALCHARDVPLLIDEAWGPHFPFHPDLPPSAMQAGADGAVASIHKLLPGITQASLLMLRGGRVDAGRFGAAVEMLETTSPAAFIYASIDACRRQMALAGRALLGRTLARAAEARAALAAIPGLAVVGPEVIADRPGARFDPTRLLVDVHGLGVTGYDAERILRERFRVGVEMSDLVSVIVMLTVADDAGTVEHLVAGFRGLAAAARVSGEAGRAAAVTRGHRSSGAVIRGGEQAMTPRQATTAPAETVTLSAAVGRIAAESVTPYPPGIPVIAPGEVVTAEIADYLRFGLAAGMYVSGPADPTLATLRVVAR